MKNQIGYVNIDTVTLGWLAEKLKKASEEAICAGGAAGCRVRFKGWKNQKPDARTG